MPAQVQEPTDTRWNGDSRTGGDATKAAPGLARVWRGYILCVYLDNNRQVSDVWTTIYDPYTHEQWMGSQRIPVMAGGKQGNLTSTMPPVAAYYNLNTVIVTATSAGPLYNVIGYPMSADTPDDFKKMSQPRQATMPCTDIDLISRPALVNFNEKIVLTYRTHANSLSTLIGTPNAEGGISWAGPHASGVGGLSDGPSVTVFKGRLLCAYTQMNGHIMVGSSGDGLTWGNWVTTAASSFYGPAIAADPKGQSLMMLYANGNTKVLNTMGSLDGHTWGGPQKCAGLTQSSPALIASAAGLMLAVYRGGDNDNVYFATTKNGIWSVL